MLIAIGNGIAGAFMTSIGFEVPTRDPDREELISCGRLDQWDLLKDITPEEWKALPPHLRPKGNWDFDQMLYGTHCSICGTEVIVNDHVYSIDSAVCTIAATAMARTRPASLSRRSGGKWPDREQVAKQALGWLSHVSSTFKQVRLDSAEIEKRRLRRLWNNSLMARALDPKRVTEVEGLLSENTVCDLACSKLCPETRRGIHGATPVSPRASDRRQFVFNILDLARQRRLSTSEN